MGNDRRMRFSKQGRASRTILLYRVLAVALLLLVGFLWPSRPANERPSKGGLKAWRRFGENDTKLERIFSQGGSEHPDEGLCDREKYLPTWELLSDQITILVNGFAESRLTLLQGHVQLYSAVPVVHSIYVLWGNTSTPPEVLEQWRVDSLGAPIYIVRQESSSLNDRFLPRSYIRTRAVMICDDDITVEGKSIAFALDVWRENQDRIVGFFPRSHSFDLQTRSWFYIKEQGRYSIMLTKVMVLATEYLFLYSCAMPGGVKAYVDEGINCEDIAMNFLVSNCSGKGPLLVDGKARDWGDTRNSGVEEHAALSSRMNHRKDRGDCITTFQKLWNGMELRFSSAKASADVENPIHCDKFGYLIDCDKSVSSRREARRVAGENVISFTHRYAYATFLPADQLLVSCLLLAQSLRSSGTVHDLVVLLDPSCSISESHVLYEHYDQVVKLGASQGPDPWNQLGKLSAWLLLDYAKVVYLEVDSLVIANLDHLFQLPEPAAAPQVFMPSKFSTGLLVLKPSNETYTLLMQSLERIRFLHSKRKRYLLNSYFDGWFEMPAENRLPARYNVPAAFSKQLRFPTWFNLSRAHEAVGPVMVVRYGSAKVVSGHYESNSVASSNVWFLARLKLFESLQKNELRPLEEDNNNISEWAPYRETPLRKISDLVWPPRRQVSLMGFGDLAPEPRQPREAFVTVLYGNQNAHFSLAGWAESFHYHHSFQSRAKTLLLVVSTLHPDQYREHSPYFDEVRVVDPFSLNGRIAHESFSLLQLWNQTDFDKLVYVSWTSLFVDNCNSLLDYIPFAAVPSLFPPDTFSTQVMSIQPNQQTYDSLRQKFLSYELYNQPVERFLNAYYSDWYLTSSMHRISPSYMFTTAFETHLQSSAQPWKILSFDLEWLPYEEANVTRLWKKTLCDLRPWRKPEVVAFLCGIVAAG